MANLVLRETELKKLLILMLVTVYLFGVIGLAVLVCMEWITRGRYAQDSVSKHGIGHENSSRLGGAVIGVAGLVGILSSQFFEFAAMEPGDYLWSWAAIALCGCLGLIEDFKNNLLSPKFRLCCLLVIFGVLFSAWPWLVPTSLGIPLLSYVMDIPAIGVMLAVLFSVGFINAVNMADGANGLMSGVAFIAFTLFAQLAVGDGWAWAILSYVVGVFLIFNVVSGRLFLGDGGAYLLGSVMVVGSFSLVQKELVSPAFLSVLFAYPCIELLVSLIRRTARGQSALLPDNDHFHNRLHSFLKSRLMSPILANSGTGLAIALMTSGTAFLGLYFDVLEATDARWGYAFLVILAIHLSLYRALGTTDQKAVRASLGSA